MWHPEKNHNRNNTGDPWVAPTKETKQRHRGKMPLRLTGGTPVPRCNSNGYQNIFQGGMTLGGTAPALAAQG